MSISAQHLAVISSKYKGDEIMATISSGQITIIDLYEPQKLMSKWMKLLN